MTKNLLPATYRPIREKVGPQGCQGYIHRFPVDPMIGKLRKAGSLLRFRKKRVTGCPPHRRLLSNQPLDYEAFVQAAKDYVKNAGVSHWCYTKPFEPSGGHRGYFDSMYPLLNILEGMELPLGGRILEVGSGPGWITEILMMLGYEVDALEPCEEMITIARHRIHSCREHYQITDCPEVRFHCTTLEECRFTDGCFDGVLFHEALHHIVDEQAGLANVYRMLAHSGAVGISGEQNWIPGDRAVELAFAEETRRFGTLENIFSRDYLIYLLGRIGFNEVEQYHSLGGLVVSTSKKRSVGEIARFPASQFLTVIARKGTREPTTRSASAKTLAKMELVTARYDPSSRCLELRLDLTNIGKTTWLHAASGRSGTVRISLCQGHHEEPTYREAGQRFSLCRSVPPGDSLIIDFHCVIPIDGATQPWRVDLLSEDVFWFSDRGTVPLHIDLREGNVRVIKPGYRAAA